MKTYIGARLKSNPLAFNKGTSIMYDKTLTRDTIIQTLASALEPLEYVHAFWEGGAAAFGRIDEWSDIDLYLVADDNKVNEAFLAFEDALKDLSPIKQKYDVQHPKESGLFQAFYRLEDTSEYLLIDLAVFNLSSPDKFLEPKVHGNAVFSFNKSDKVKPPQLDRDALIRKVQRRLKRLQARFDMFNIFVQKEINRGNYLEAIDFYRALILASIVEALRIKYNPVHHDFKMHYLQYELPPDVIKKLTSFYFVKDAKDFQEKYDEATKWFFEIMSKIDQKQIERIVKTL